MHTMETWAEDFFSFKVNSLSQPYMHYHQPSEENS